MRFSTHKKTSKRSLLPRKGPWDWVQLFAFQWTGCWRLSANLKPMRHPLKHLCYTLLNGQARAGSSTCNESADFDPRRIDFKGAVWWNGRLFRRPNYAKWKQLSVDDRNALAVAQTRRSSDSFMHRIPQYRCRAGVPQTISGFSKFICQGCSICPQVPRRHAPNDTKHEWGIDLGN